MVVERHPGEGGGLPALVLQAAPAAVGILGAQALVAVLVLLAVLHPHLAQLPVRHHVDVVPLQVEQQVRPDRRAGREGQVGIPGQSSSVQNITERNITYSMPLLPLSTTAFLRLPSLVPRKATVKSPVLVAVTCRVRELDLVNAVGDVATHGSTAWQF